MANNLERSQQEQRSFGILVLFIMMMTYWATVWTPYFNPVQVVEVKEGQASTPAAQSAPLTPTPQVVSTPSQPLAQAEVATPSQLPSDAQLGASENVAKVETERYHATLSLLGGRLLALQLRDYQTHLGDGAAELDLISHLEQSPLPLGVYSGGVDDTWVKYALQAPVPAANEREFTVAAGSSLPLQLTGRLPDGRVITKTITFFGGDYFVDVAVNVSAPPLDGSRLELEWTKLIPAESESFLDHTGVAGAMHFDGQKALHTLYSKITDQRTPLGEVRWASLADKYFTVNIIAPEGSYPAQVWHQNQVFRLRAAASNTGGAFKLFLGPKSYTLLTKAGFDLHRSIDFGVFAFLSVPLLSLLNFFHKVFQNWGLSIIILTILVRTAMLPLTVAAFKQMRAMGDLKPEVDRIRERIQDKQQQQMELMALYKKKGVNPLGGCLPMVLQIPIFLGLYNALLAAIELRHAPFALWIQDLAAPDRLQIFGFGIPVLVILFVASMLLQQWLTPPTPGMDPTQRKIMMVMPLFLGFMFVGFPAGLTLYWLTSNIISIGQSRAMQHGKASPFAVTGAVSAAVFAFAFVLTKL
jgi:YidC/Oxa1 family membrane protein insertase